MSGVLSDSDVFGARMPIKLGAARGRVQITRTAGADKIKTRIGKLPSVLCVVSLVASSCL